MPDTERLDGLEERLMTMEETVREIHGTVKRLDNYFSGNGHLILSVEKRKFRFAGSFRIPTALLTLGGTGGFFGILGTALGWW